jgi:hypothetical protein
MISQEGFLVRHTVVCRMILRRKVWWFAYHTGTVRTCWYLVFILVMSYELNDLMIFQTHAGHWVISRIFETVPLLTLSLLTMHQKSGASVIISYHST